MAAAAVPIKGAFRAPLVLGPVAPAAVARALLMPDHPSRPEVDLGLPVELGRPPAALDALLAVVAAQAPWEGHSQASPVAPVARAAFPPSQGPTFNTVVVVVVVSTLQAMSHHRVTPVPAVPGVGELAGPSLCQRTDRMRKTD